VRTADDELVIALPLADKALPGIAAEDIGRCAFGIFAAGTEYIGKTVGIAGEHLGGAELAAGLSEALGEPVRYDAITPAAFRAREFPGADSLGNMLQYNAAFSREFRGARNVGQSRELNPQLLTFRAWLAANRDSVRVGSAAA
jgi:hypothetical protein